jgi:hypothetical protein
LLLNLSGQPEQRHQLLLGLLQAAAARTAAVVAALLVVLVVLELAHLLLVLVLEQLGTCLWIQLLLLQSLQQPLHHCCSCWVLQVPASGSLLLLLGVPCPCWLLLPGPLLQC